MPHPRGGRPCRKSKVFITKGPQTRRTSHSFLRMFANTAPNSLNQRPCRRCPPPPASVSTTFKCVSSDPRVVHPFPSKRPWIFFFFSDCYHTVWRDFSSQAFGVARGRYLIRHDIQFVSWKQRQLRNISVHPAGHWKSRRTPRGPKDDQPTVQFSSEPTTTTRALKAILNPELFNLAGVETIFKNKELSDTNTTLSVSTDQQKWEKKIFLIY